MSELKRSGIQNIVTRNSTYIASNHDLIFCDTTAGSFTITLPPSPRLSAEVVVQDVSGTFAVNPISINTSDALTILGDTTKVLDTTSGVYTFVYTGTEWHMDYPSTVLSMVNVIGNPTDIDTFTGVYNHMYSSGILSGCDLTDNLNGSINISSGSATIRATGDTGHGPLYSAEVPASNTLTLADNSINYVYVSYNNGVTLSWGVSGDPTIINMLDIIPAYVVVREGNVLSYLDTRHQNVNHIAKSQLKEFYTSTFVRKNGGMVISDAGSLHIACTAGSFYFQTNEYVASALDTTGLDTFEYYKHVNGAFVEVVSQTIDTLNYDDGTNLVAVGNNNYSTHWVYAIVGSNPHYAIVYGNNKYTNIAGAQAASVPTDLPTSITGLGVLLGKIIAQSGNPEIISVETAFTATLSTTLVTDHENLAGLQGGSANEHLHLTSAQLAIVNSTSGTNTGDQSKADIDALNIDAATLGTLTKNQFLRSDVSDIFTGALLTIQNEDGASKLNLNAGATSTNAYVDFYNQASARVGYIGNVSGIMSINGGAGNVISVSSPITTNSTIDGRDISADGTKLDLIEANANNYTHPTTDGSLHVPATSTINNGKVLTAGATAGSLSWTTPTIGTVTSVVAGNGMTQTGTSSVNPTLNIVSHAGTAGTIGTINISADSIGVNLGTTSTTAARGDHSHSYLPLTGGTISSNLVVSGNLTVNGTTTTVNTETILLADNIITLNSNSADIPVENAGIEIERGLSPNVSIRWNETNDVWETTSDGTNFYELITNADTSGLSVTSADKWTTARTITLSGDVSGTSPAWDGSGNLSFSNTVVANNSHTHTSANISDATNLNTANTIVKRDASGNFIAGTITGDLNGNASSATTAAALTGTQATAITDNSTFISNIKLNTSNSTVAVDGYENLDGGTLDIAAVTYHDAVAAVAALGARLPTVEEFEAGVVAGTGGGFDSLQCWTCTSVPGQPGFVYKIIGTGAGARTAVDTSSVATAYTRYVRPRVVPTDFVAHIHTHVGVYEPIDATILRGANIGSTVQAYSSALDLVSGTNTGDQTTITGNAGTATVLQTARTINGVSFNGSANITVADSTKLPLAGGTITGMLTVNGGMDFQTSGFNLAFLKDSTTRTSLQWETNGVLKWSLQHTAGEDLNFLTSGGVNLTKDGNIIYHAGNIPTWNQSTTGNAATATTASKVTMYTGAGTNEYPLLWSTVTPNGQPYWSPKITFNEGLNRLKVSIVAATTSLDLGTTQEATIKYNSVDNSIDFIIN